VFLYTVTTRNEIKKADFLKLLKEILFLMNFIELSIASNKFPKYIQNDGSFRIILKNNLVIDSCVFITGYVHACTYYESSIKVIRKKFVSILPRSLCIFTNQLQK